MTILNSTEQSVQNPLHSNANANNDNNHYNFTTRVISNKVVYQMLVEFSFCYASYYAGSKSKDFVISGNLTVVNYLIMDGVVRTIIVMFAIYLFCKIQKGHNDLAKDCASWCAVILWIIWESINFFVTTTALGICSNCIMYLYVLLFHSILFFLILTFYTYKKRLCCFVFVNQSSNHFQIGHNDQQNKQSDYDFDDEL